MWKLADFGLTVEGSSRTNRPTQYARGTQGYRAPELLESDNEPTYTNKVDVWSMGCILYELATGARAFQTDYAVLLYLSSRKNKDVVLDDTFDAHSIETITKHIVDMLQIESSARPSASVLSKEFTRECQLIQVNHPVSQQLNSVSSSITLLELSDDTEQTQSIPQNHQVIVTEGDNSKPILPSHLIGVSLYSVAEKGDVEAVKILLNAKADVNAQGGEYGNALQAASWCGHEAVVRLLLDKGADVNCAGRELRQRSAGSILVRARGGGSTAAGQGRGRQRAGRVLRQRSAGGILEGHEAVVRLLLDKGADVNAQGGEYGNALQAAS